MKIILKTKPENIDVERLAMIIYRLRETTKFWKEHYGAGPRMAKERWEEKADEWIRENVRVDKEEW